MPSEPDRPRRSAFDNAGSQLRLVLSVPPSMLTLLLQRHAKAAPKGSGRPDRDRALSPKGRSHAARMGRKIEIEGLVPDRILASSALRARETARIIVEESGFRGTVDLEDRLYCAGARTILDAAAEVRGRPERLMIVGHNPGLEEVVALLCRREEHLSAGSLAVLRIDAESFSDLRPDTRATLESVLSPKTEG